MCFLHHLGQKTEALWGFRRNAMPASTRSTRTIAAVSCWCQYVSHFCKPVMCAQKTLFCSPPYHYSLEHPPEQPIMAGSFMKDFWEFQVAHLRSAAAADPW